MTLVYLTIAWLMGIALARWLEPSGALLAALTVAGLAAAACGQRTEISRLWAVLAVVALLGAWRYRLAQPTLDEGTLAYYNDRGQATLWGTVSAEPSVRSTYTQLELAVEQLSQDGQRHPVRGRVVLNVPNYPEREYGDLLGATGDLETPPVIEDFSYREYLAARGVHSLLREAQVESIGTPRRGDALALRWLYRLKRSARQVLEAALPNPDAGFLEGILLGLGNTLPEDLAGAFRAVGLTHIIVISGSNVSLVIYAAMLAARRVFSRGWALWISLGMLILFMLFVGPSAPVLRAIGMGALLIGGQMLGRRSHALTALAATALLMTAMNPLSLWQVSFQLSFVATLALVAFEPALARSLEGRQADATDRDRPAPRWRWLRELFLVTLAAQLLTLPLICYHFGELSTISLLANALVLPVQPPLMALGYLALAAGAAWAPTGWIVWPLTRYCLLVIQGLAALPWASIQVPHFGWGLVAGLYAALALGFSPNLRRRVWAWARALFRGPRAGRVALGTLLLAVVLLWSAVGSLPDGKLHVYFLDVGQGDAILLRTPGGRTILVDGGPDPLLLSSRLGQILPFWQRRIDLVAVTHADQDHLGGLTPVVQRYHVGQVLEPPAMEASALTAQWRGVLTATGTSALPLSRGMSIGVGRDLRLEVLDPRPAAWGEPPCEGNRCSLVLEVVMGRARLLLAGDMDAEMEDELRSAGLPLRAAVLKVAHHGAATATTAGFLAAVKPGLAVISVGRDNRYGHPAAEVLKRLADAGCQVMRTDQRGTVELVSDGRQIWIAP